MTQMTAQVFFVIAQAKDAVLVPVSALRPARRGGEQRPAEPADATPQAKAPAATGGAAKGGGRARGAESGIDPRTRFANGRALVRVMKADGTLEQREVQVGVVSRVSAEIVSGLEAGEQVVTGQRQAAPAPAAKAANTPRMQPRI
jgi:macrolide-specific efflux system membrane fusion protein